jgi:hypothetical protein
MSDAEIQSLWDDRVGWSKTSDRLKRTRESWRTIVLTLTVAGAALQTAAATWPEQKMALGLPGALALAAVAIIGRYFLKPENAKKWLRARSVSEGMKSEIYTYRAGAEPYTGPDAMDKLRGKLKEIYGWAQGLDLERAKTGEINEPAPPQLDHEQYIEKRVLQQIRTYYQPKAQKNAWQAEVFNWAEIGFAAIAALLGAVATFSGDASSVSSQLGTWVAVLTTIAGSIAAHAAASRFEFQAATFYATARQLKDLEGAWRSNKAQGDIAEWSKFVRGCEDVISAENRDWMAKLDQNQV